MPQASATAVTAAADGSLAIEGLRSLEVRWILPGQAGTAMEEWFGRFPAEIAVRDDSYLLDPALRGLSVKVRAAKAFEVKVCHGSPGLLDMPGCALGRTEFWRKWSFPAGPPGPASGGPAGWTVVRKRRRIARFLLAGGRIVTGTPQRAAEPACAVELTDVHVGGAAWWSLAFEATGPATLLRSTLESTASAVFAQAPPQGVELCVSHCQSYAEWLARRHARVTS